MATEPKPHYRLRTDGTLYRWRGKLLGWKKAGVIDGRVAHLRRTGWPIPDIGREGLYS